MKRQTVEPNQPFLGLEMLKAGPTVEEAVTLYKEASKRTPYQHVAYRLKWQAMRLETWCALGVCCALPVNVCCVMLSLDML